MCPCTLWTFVVATSPDQYPSSFNYIQIANTIFLLIFLHIASIDFLGPRFYKNILFLFLLYSPPTILFKDPF